MCDKVIRMTIIVVVIMKNTNITKEIFKQSKVVITLLLTIKYMYNK